MPYRSLLLKATRYFKLLQNDFVLDQGIFNYYFLNISLEKNKTKERKNERKKERKVYSYTLMSLIQGQI